MLPLWKGRPFREGLPATHGCQKHEPRGTGSLDGTDDARMDEINLLAPSEETETLPELLNQDFPTGSR